MLRRWRTARLRVIDQRHCRVQRSTANVICMQIAVCARSPSEPEHQPPTRHRHYPHSACTLSGGFVQSGFYEVALMPALLASPYHATSQNPQDSHTARVTGNLTMLGVSRPVTLIVNVGEAIFRLTDVRGVYGQRTWSLTWYGVGTGLDDALVTLAPRLTCVLGETRWPAVRLGKSSGTWRLHRTVAEPARFGSPRAKARPRRNPG